MGQCSTLPAEGRTSTQEPGGRYNMSSPRDYGMEDHAPPPPPQPSPVPTIPQRNRLHRHGSSNVILQVTVPRTEEKPQSPRVPSVQQPQMQQYQTREASSGPQPMQEDMREAPPPLDNAKRARCYQLNLESDFVGISGDVRVEGSLLGPYEQPPPPLTYSASDDSSQHTNPIEVAIRTAQIFRGITIAQDGTILTQNARATRSNKGSKEKRGEKSRQAAKIDKAKDLVEESIITGKAPGTNEPANLVSLYIMGEYDEMKYLVRDGSKKLRDANGLPDDALLAVNRSRSTSFLTNSGMLSPNSRKRVSPSGGASSDHFISSPRSPPVLNSAPPKLKGHPRDHSSSRREERRAFVPVPEACFGPQYGETSGETGDNDWIGISNGFNSIWNCGQNNESGTASPIQVVTREKDYQYGNVHGRQQTPRVNEGRNETSYNGRRDPTNITART